MPLGILLKNENKGDDMVDIMKVLHQYVPSVEYARNTYKTCVGEVEVHVPQLKYFLVVTSLQLQEVVVQRYPE